MFAFVCSLCGRKLKYPVKKSISTTSMLYYYIRHSITGFIHKCDCDSSKRMLDSYIKKMKKNNKLYMCAYQ